MVFRPKTLGADGDLRMILCHSLIAGSVVGKSSGSGDTEPLPYAKELV